MVALTAVRRLAGKPNDNYGPSRFVSVFDDQRRRPARTPRSRPTHRSATGSIPGTISSEMPAATRMRTTSFETASTHCWSAEEHHPADRWHPGHSPRRRPTARRHMAGDEAQRAHKKVVIFETDGLPNCSATASLVNAGSYSYYKIRYDMNNPNGSEYPSVTATTINNLDRLEPDLFLILKQLAGLDNGTSRNPFRLYTIGFRPGLGKTQARRRRRCKPR